MQELDKEENVSCFQDAPWLGHVDLAPDGVILSGQYSETHPIGGS